LASPGQACGRLVFTLYPINPITLQKYREAFVTSRAKDDTKDADYQADLLLTHHQSHTLGARRQPDPRRATTGLPSPGRRG
jgi:hypothetical protein